jgi:hypothetical protein
MAKLFLTAADLAARRGTDKEIGLVQQIINQAPELAVLSGRPIPGTSTHARVQIGISKGGAFRAFNAGVIPGAGAYERRRFETFFFDSHLSIDEAEVIAAQQDGDTIGDLQADEVAGALQDKSIKFSQQFYGGTNLNAGGFPGLIDILKIYNGNGVANAGVIDSRTGKPIVNFIDAGGAGNGSTECVWYVWNNPQGVGFIFGGNQTIDMKPWVWQYVPDPADPKKQLRKNLTNISGFIGLVAAHPWCVACIKNIDAAHPWTDALTSKLDQLIPEGIQYTHCFATKRARGYLQQSRTVVLQANQQTGNAKNLATVSQVPTQDMNGVPIIVTDGIQLQNNF